MDITSSKTVSFMDATKRQSKGFSHGLRQGSFLKFLLKLSLFLILVDANLASKQLNITQLEW